MQTISADNTNFRFRIELRDIAPPIWRRIDVPGDYSFWDLHVAIQDAMGWLDYHLHAFRLAEAGRNETMEIGIPDENEFMPIQQTIAGWDVALSSHFHRSGQSVVYEYDFGDGWIHDVLLEEIIPSEKSQRVACVDGQRACPPEDCGGTWGYQTLLEALRVPTHEEHEDMLRWIGGKFDSEYFDPGKVKFDDPQERWTRAFERRWFRQVSDTSCALLCNGLKVGQLASSFRPYLSTSYDGHRGYEPGGRDLHSLPTSHQLLILLNL